MGTNAGDMIGQISLAMTQGIGLGAIANAIHPYPTQAVDRAEIFTAETQWSRKKRRVFGSDAPTGLCIIAQGCVRNERYPGLAIRNDPYPNGIVASEDGDDRRGV